MNTPNPRPALAYENPDFMQSAEARLVRITAEFLHPAKVLTQNQISNTVVFFGSARIPETSVHYQKARELARKIAAWSEKLYKGRIVVATGGGPSIMEAANRGANDIGAKTLGLGIKLPFEQRNNDYVTGELSFSMKYFFLRKFWLAAPAIGFTAFPGGFGTMDELFEILTLIQTGKMKPIPVVLMGKDFWTKLINFDLLVEEGVISKSDLKLILITDDVEEAFRYLTNGAEDRLRKV